MNGGRRWKREDLRHLAPGTFVLFLSAMPAFAQVSGPSVHVRGTYTTTAKFFANPSSTSTFVRNEFTGVEGLTGFAAGVEIPLWDDEYSIGLSVEYLPYVDEGMKRV